MKHISGIYQIQSKRKPKRCYIGSAVNVDGRWRIHLHYLRNKKHENNKLQGHYNKYGEDDLQFSLLLGCDKEDLIKIEQYFIDSKKPSFNICQVAGNCLGRKMSEHTKRVLSESHIGRTISEETRQRMRLAQKGNHYGFQKGTSNWIGRKHSEESKQKMSQSHKGKKVIHSEETKRKISKSVKKDWDKRKLKIV